MGGAHQRGAGRRERLEGAGRDLRGSGAESSVGGLDLVGEHDVGHVPILSAMVDIPGWRVERVPITHPDAALLVEEVQEEYVRRYGGRDETPIEPTYFEEPMGSFFV